MNNKSSWLIQLDQTETSYLLLGSLVGIGLIAAILFRIGLLGWILEVVGRLVRGSIRRGFLLWELLLSWASWPTFLALVLGFLFVGGAAGGRLAGLRILCGLIPMMMGVLACFAYMFIDLERNEVRRGYKAIHNPLKGQLPATNLRALRQTSARPLAHRRRRGGHRRLRAFESRTV